MSAHNAISNFLQSNEFTNLLNKFYLPIAFANENKIFTWNNEKFISYFGSRQLDKNFQLLFDIEENKISDKRITQITYRNINVDVQPIYKKQTHIGYAIILNILPENVEEIVGQFNVIKNIAHDFNNMFTSILSSLELLKQKLPEDEKYSYLIDNIENNSFRAAEIIEDLLMKDPKAAKQKRKIYIHNLINETANSVRHTISSSIKLSTELPNNLRQVYGKYSELYRVIMNLCINAAEAISGVGKILLTGNNLNVTEENREQYKKLKDGNYIEIRIKDSGIGIHPENLKRIFDPGFSTKDRTKESGLGLNIIRKIITDHDGFISVKSTINGGTEFTIILPAIIKKESFQELSDKTILIAEDEETLQELLSELLESYNYHVIRTSNGNEVIDLLDKNVKIDLLIIDYKMPDLDGIECIKKIKEKNITIPIILSSGSGTAASNEEIEKLNVDRVLIKPYDFEKLLDIIQKLIV